MHRAGRFFWPSIIYLRLSPRPVTALEIGSHPKLTQIADALVYVGDRGRGHLPTPGGSGGFFLGFRVDKTVDLLAIHGRGETPAGVQAMCVPYWI
jgi:hypothetical protein